MGFCVKELAKDITQSEISFLNKCLKTHCGHYRREPGKRTLAGEKWPSNEWPSETKVLAYALLTLKRRDHSPVDIIRNQIQIPVSKAWGLGTPNYDGSWEDHVFKYTGFKLEDTDEPRWELPSSDDNDYFPPLDSPEFKKRSKFVDLLDEIK